MNKFISVYINTKISGDYIDSETDPLVVLQTAKKNDTIYEIGDGSYFCCCKTKFNNEDSILIVFSIEIVGPANGSSSASEKIMFLVDGVCRVLGNTDFISYTKKSTNEKRKNVSLIKIIKIIREDDIL